jgi:hypothetical protein
MLYESKIKLTSPILGDTRMPDGVRKLNRTDEGRITVPMDYFAWAVREASMLCLPPDTKVDVGCIQEVVAFESPATGIYNRRHRKGTEVFTTSFEAIRKGAELDVKLLVHSSIREEKLRKLIRPPTSEEVSAIWGNIGLYYGISQWGGKFGFGRFQVLSCSPFIPAV